MRRRSSLNTSCEVITASIITQLTNPPRRTAHSQPIKMETHPEKHQEKYPPHSCSSGTFSAYYRRGGGGVPIVSRRATYASQSRSGVRGSDYHMHFGKRGDQSCLRREESSGKGPGTDAPAQWTNTNSWSSGDRRAKADGDRFVTQNKSIVTAQVGASVILHCKTSSATGGLIFLRIRCSEASTEKPGMSWPPIR
ncbi:hypothetical protein O3P69_010535 [Scylla paramamosain]|uniref:Uncharacterized protein n=1 Tax=Scylla paramamosain TaxID=85552 RepID=A0AAW0SF49_SCYPA